MGAMPLSVNIPLTIMFVEVLTSVTELVRIEENAIGISSFDALISDFQAMPNTIGRKNAVEAVLLMNAPRTADAIITVHKSRSGVGLARLSTARPAMSTTPVRCRAAVRINRPRIMITVSLPNPSKAFFTGKSPVKTRVSRTPSAVTSADTGSHQNRKTEITTIQRSMAICGVMRTPAPSG